MLIGGALGFLWAPCAGPILAAVISVGATEGASLELVLVALSFGIGSAAVLLLIALGGRRVLDRVRRAGRGPALQRALGAVMALTAVAMAAELDLRFQEALADDAPAFLVNPTRALEDSGAVEDRLADLRGEPRFEASASPHGSGAAAPHRARRRPGRARHRARLPGRGPMAQQPPALAGRAARPGGAGRLLDLHLHQLHPHASLI